MGNGERDCVRNGEASPATEGAPQRRLPGVRGAGAQPAPTPQSRLRWAAKRNAPPRRPPPPARRAAARQSLAPEAAPTRSSRHPDAGLDPAPQRKITERRKSRVRGHSSRKPPNCGPVPGKGAPNRTGSYLEKAGSGDGGKLTRPGKFPPVRASERGSNAPERPEPQSGPPASGTCLFPRLQQRGPGGAARPIGHERGFLQLSRPRCLPREAPLSALHPEDAELGWGQRSRAPQEEGGRGDRAPGTPHPAPDWPLAPRPRSERRGPRRTLAAAGAAGSPGRGCPAVHIRCPSASMDLPAVRGRGWRRRRVSSTQSPAGAARPGVLSTLMSGRLQPAPLVRSPGPGWAGQLRRSAASRRWRARRLRQRAACPGAGEPSSGAAAADLG